MGEEVEQQEFSREDRTRYREKVRRCLDVFARMLRESRFDADYPMTGLEIELNLVDDAGDPALKNVEALEAIADPDFQTELGQFNLEINVPPKQLKDRGFTDFEEGVRRSLNAAGAKADQVGAHMVMIGILPTLSAGHMSPSSLSSNPRYQLLSDQILAARGEDIVIDIGGPERLRTTAGLDRPRGRLHQHPAAHPGQPRGLPRLLERLPGDRRRAAGARRQLAVPARPRAVARDPDRAVRAGDRHPQRGAQGAGRPSAGVVRRAVDQLDLRPVRGERPLLPGAAPDHRRRGPARAARGGRDARRWPSCGCTTARSTGGTGRSTTSSTARPTCASRTACCPPGRPSPTRWPTPRSTSGWPARLPSTSGRCGRRCRSARRRRTSTSRPGRASTPTSTGPASARSRPPSWCCAGCCRWHEPASTPGESWPRRATGCSASSSSAASPAQNGASWFVDKFHARAGNGDGDRLDALRSTLNEYRGHMHTNDPVHSWD